MCVFFGGFLTIGVLPRTDRLPPSGATDATITFLVHTFLTLIVLANFSLLQWIVRGDESRAKNTITQRVTLEECGLATGSYDGVP